MTSLTEETQVTTEKPSKKAAAGARRANAAAAKPKAGNNAKPTKKAPKAAKKTDGARAGSKTAEVLDLLKRPEGTTLKELMKVTGWQAHSVRGLLRSEFGDSWQTGSTGR